MILHLGADYMVPLCEVIAIIDADAALKSRETKDFLDRNMKEKVVRCCIDHEIKSYILAKEKGTFCVYLSAISSQTLLKRTCLKSAVHTFKAKTNTTKRG